MSEKFEGICMKGPLAGEWWAHWSKTKKITQLWGATMVKGSYEWFDGIWLWNEPNITSLDDHKSPK